MTPDNDSQIVPRAPRFKVADTNEVLVSITRTEESDHQPLAAELLDVSQHGAKLRVPVNLRFEETLHLEIKVPGNDLEYQGVASVRYIRAVDEEHWLVGCAIAPPLSDETFSFLATTAGAERRRFRRTNIAAEATVRRQAQAEGIPAALHNLSSGGFCFSSADKYEVGELVQFTFEGNDGEPRVIEARICWEVDSPDGSIAGCQFSSRESYATICDCLTEHPAGGLLNRQDAEPTSKIVLTAAVLAMFLPPMMTLMMQSNQVSADAGVAPPAAKIVKPLEDEVELEVSNLAEPTQLDQELLEVASTDSQPQVVEDEEVQLLAEPTLTPVTKPPVLREWIDNTGRHRTLAELVRVTTEHVVLRRPDGRESKAPWHRLSDADQAFARDWQSRAE